MDIFKSKLLLPLLFSILSNPLYANTDSNNTSSSDSTAITDSIKIGGFLASAIAGPQGAEASDVVGWIFSQIGQHKNPDTKILHDLNKLNKKLEVIETELYTVTEIEEQILLSQQSDSLKPYLHTIKDTFWVPILTAAQDNDTSTLHKKLEKVLSASGGLTDIVSDIDSILYDQTTNTDLISSMAVFYTKKHYPAGKPSPIFNDKAYYKDLHKWLASIHYYRTLATMMLVEAHHYKVIKKGYTSCDLSKVKSSEQPDVLYHCQRAAAHVFTLFYGNPGPTHLRVSTKQGMYYQLERAGYPLSLAPSSAPSPSPMTAMLVPPSGGGVTTASPGTGYAWLPVTDKKTDTNNVITWYSNGIPLTTTTSYNPHPQNPAYMTFQYPTNNQITIPSDLQTSFKKVLMGYTSFKYANLADWNNLITASGGNITEKNIKRIARLSDVSYLSINPGPNLSSVSTATLNVGNLYQINPGAVTHWVMGCTDSSALSPNGNPGTRQVAWHGNTFGPASAPCGTIWYDSLNGNTMKDSPYVPIVSANDCSSGNNINPAGWLKPCGTNWVHTLYEDLPNMKCLRAQYERLSDKSAPKGSGTSACPNAPMPAGSYAISCQNITWNRGILTASCPGANAPSSNATLNYAEVCAHNAEITNTQGLLTCSINSSIAQGSYINTCNNIQVSGSTITASCRGGGGKFTTSSIDFSSCKTLYNDGGQLKCASIK